MKIKHLLGFMLLLWLFSCNEQDDQPGLSLITVVSGGEQTGARGEALTQPITIKLTDPGNNPISDVSLSYELRDFSGAIDQTELVTNANGEVSFFWTLGKGRDNQIAFSFEGDPTHGAAETTELTIAAPYEYKTPELSDDGWEVANALDLNFDRVWLENLIDRIDDGAFGSVHGLAIVKDNRLILEQHFPEVWPGTTRNEEILPSRNGKHLSFSVTKSVFSALIGIALEEGDLSLNQPIYSFFDYDEYDNWDPEKSSISIKNALQMRTGLGCSENGASEQADDPIKYTLDLPMTGSPGGVFNYCTDVSNVLGAILEKATGRSLQSYARVKLFQPLNIQNEDWWIIQDRATAGSSLYWSMRDMLKFGQIYLNKGEWNGQQIVPREWIDNSTSVHVDTGWFYDYGLHWWKTQLAHRGIPVNTTVAIGAGGQRIFVLEELNMVIAMTGGNIDVFPESTRYAELLTDFLFPAFD